MGSGLLPVLTDDLDVVKRSVKGALTEARVDQLIFTGFEKAELNGRYAFDRTRYENNKPVFTSVGFGGQQAELFWTTKQWAFAYSPVHGHWDLLAWAPESMVSIADLIRRAVWTESLAPGIEKRNAKAVAHSIYDFVGTWWYSCFGPRKHYTISVQDGAKSLYFYQPDDSLKGTLHWHGSYINGKLNSGSIEMQLDAQTDTLRSQFWGKGSKSASADWTIVASTSRMDNCSVDLKINPAVSDPRSPLQVHIICSAGRCELTGIDGCYGSRLEELRSKGSLALIVVVGDAFNHHEPDFQLDRIFLLTSNKTDSTVQAGGPQELQDWLVRHAQNHNQLEKVGCLSNLPTDCLIA